MTQQLKLRVRDLIDDKGDPRVTIDDVSSDTPVSVASFVHVSASMLDGVAIRYYDVRFHASILEASASALDEHDVAVTIHNLVTLYALANDVYSDTSFDIAFFLDIPE